VQWSRQKSASGSPSPSYCEGVRRLTDLRHISSFFRVLLTWCVAGLISACMTGAAHADGKFMPNVKAIVRDPAMPSQAAIISHRDGVETLIVESGVESDGTPLAWVMPVPSEPMEIAPVSPGALATALEVSSPWVFDTEKAVRGVQSAAVAVAVAIVIGLAFRFAVRRRLPGVVAAVLLLGVVVVLGLPALANTRSLGSSSGVAIVRTVSAGTYDVDVVRASHADELVDWLTQREFALPQSARAAVDAYIAEGWLFCAASVALGKGLSAPHPLKLVFASERIVYPMRLTAAGGGMLDLDLVVFSSERVSHPTLGTWFEQQPTGVTAADPPTPWSFRSNGVVGHPDLVPLLLPRGWMTRLHGRLDLSSDGSDLTLLPPSRAPSTIRLASRGDAALVLAVAALWTIAMVIVSVLPFARNRVDAAKRGTSTRGVVPVLVILSVAVGCAIGWAGLSRLEIAEFEKVVSKRPGIVRSAWSFASEAIAAGLEVDEIRIGLAKALDWTDGAGRPVTREGLEVPYGWSVVHEKGSPEGDRVTVTIYEPSGRPMRLSTGETEWRPVVVREPGVLPPVESPPASLYTPRSQ
jgi:Uncharacterized protein conserved in bacteria (DUF2330)